MRHTAYFNTESIAWYFFKQLEDVKSYNGKRIKGIGMGGGKHYRADGGFTFTVTWDTV